MPPMGNSSFIFWTTGKHVHKCGLVLGETSTYTMAMQQTTALSHTIRNWRMLHPVHLHSLRCSITSYYSLRHVNLSTKIRNLQRSLRLWKHLRPSRCWRFCTQYASNIIAEQMKLASSVSYVLTTNKEVVEVKSPNGSIYIVHPSCSDWSMCSCNFYKTMLIPCRHIFAAWQFLELPTFDSSLVPQLWHKQYQLGVEDSCDQLQQASESPDMQVSSFSRKELPTYPVIRNTIKCWVYARNWLLLWYARI